MSNAIRLISTDTKIEPRAAMPLARRILENLPAKPETYGDRFLKGLGSSVVKLAQEYVGASQASQESALQEVTLETAWERNAAGRNTAAHQNKMVNANNRADERIRQAAVAMALRTSNDFERLQSSLTEGERNSYEALQTAFERETLNSVTVRERGEAREKFVKGFGELRAAVILRASKSADATDAITATQA